MLYIRTDMNHKIATGHLMRCLSIADSARSLGENTTFILADYQAVQIIKARGYHIIVLNTIWNNMDDELSTMQNVINKYDIKKLLIDSYQVTERYLYILSKKIEVVYLDDLNLFIYPVHTLICYANYWKNFCYELRYSYTRLLLGTQYVPIRECFEDCRKKQISPMTECILLLSGGTDPFHILEKILEEINKERYKSIDVICGRYYESYEQFCLQYKTHTNVHFHRSVSNIEDYMIQADMAISAGGTTLYELCACGTPTISYSFADNQLNNVLQFHEDNVIDYAGDYRYTDIFKNIANFLDQYHENSQLRKERSERMQKLVDGKGAKRIAEELIGAVFNVRK